MDELEGEEWVERARWIKACARRHLFWVVGTWEPPFSFCVDGTCSPPFSFRSRGSVVAAILYRGRGGVGREGQMDQGARLSPFSFGSGARVRRTYFLFWVHVVAAILVRGGKEWVEQARKIRARGRRHFLLGLGGECSPPFKGVGGRARHHFGHGAQVVSPPICSGVGEWSVPFWTRTAFMSPSFWSGGMVGCNHAILVRGTGNFAAILKF